jgi:glycosyltransferase involved in cell wall biosynthesis
MNLERLHKIDDYNRDFRQSFCIRDDQLIFLQPTRVKRNKAIEQSIKLVSEINESMKKDHVLMITGSPVYSRQNYFEEIVKKVKRHNVNVIFANDRIFLGRHQNSEQKFYSINDAYVHADVVLYPSTSDAFGNPVIEAAAYRKPLVVNNYPNLEEMKGKGFQFVVMDQKVTPETVSDTCELIMDPEKKTGMTENNFRLVRAHYSSRMLDKSLYDMVSMFDQERSLVSRFASILPTRIFHKDAEPKAQDTGKIKKEKEQPPMKTVKVERDLRNRKGGYKEPYRGANNQVKK